MAEPEVRERVLALLRKHGWNATSFQAVESGFSYWFDGQGACVSYVDTGGAWVAAGAPIAAPRRLARAAERFAEAAAAQGRRSVFFATEARFSRRTGFRAHLIGEQPVWDPRTWTDQPARARALEPQIRRARRKGVEVRAVPPEVLRDPAHPLRLAIEGLIARWLAARPMAPMGFLVDVQPFAFVEERRCFVAERAGAVVGFLAAVPVYARAGWLFEDLLRDRSAPNGTAELLVDAAMRAVAAEGSRYVTLGLAALAGATPGWLALARRLGALLYDFDGVYAFRAKLRPDRWEPLYVSTRPGGRPGTLAGTVAGTVAIWDSLKAFARGRLIGFGVATLLRGPAFVVRMLAALLVPWIVLLACAGERWFPGPAAKAGWLSFDAVLAVALFSLAAQWRRWLGLLLAVAVSADALVTVAQLALDDLPRRGGGWGATLIFGIAAAAPALAAVILWNAINHRRLRPGRRRRDASSRSIP